MPDGPANEHKVLESGAAQGTEPRNAARQQGAPVAQVDRAAVSLIKTGGSAQGHETVTIAAVSRGFSISAFPAIPRSSPIFAENSTTLFTATFPVPLSSLHFSSRYGQEG